MDFLHTCAFVLANGVQLLLDIVMIAMFLRAVLSFFVSPDADFALLTVLAAITEPFILPFRALMVKFNLLQDSPIDFSFSVAMLAVWLVSAMLPTITL